VVVVVGGVGDVVDVVGGVAAIVVVVVVVVVFVEFPLVKEIVDPPSLAHIVFFNSSAPLGARPPALFPGKLFMLNLTVPLAQAASTTAPA
jgi:hypothetical protein